MAVGIDHIEELVTDSMNNIRKDPGLNTLMESGRLKLVVGDGRKGHPPEGPYDAIHVGAAAPQIPQDVSTSSHSQKMCFPVLFRKMNRIKNSKNKKTL